MSVDNWPNELTDLNTVIPRHPLDPDGLRRLLAAIVLLAMKDAATDPDARNWLHGKDAAQMFEFFGIDPKWLTAEHLAAARLARRNRTKLDD